LKASCALVIIDFALPGIHGRPYIDWNSVAGVPGQHWDGYCTHNSILFAPWHRPYLALYEVSRTRQLADLVSINMEQNR
jgi:tyrosinase